LSTNDSAIDGPQAKTTGVTDYLYRWYDPLTGRWKSRDTIEEEGGLNLYGFVVNDPVRRIDVLGMAADDSYTTREEAIKAASNDVWLATSATVQAGLAEYTETTSDEQFIALFRMRKDKLLSRGNYHISGFEFARNQIRTVYGVEFWTFVCCNENETWSYNGLSKGKVPDEEVFFDFGAEGTTAAIPNNTWREMAAKECTFVHSHNVLVKRAKWDNNSLHRSSYVASNTLSDEDIGIIRDFNISVIAVSDYSFPAATVFE
jgi:RHS repeat-associated protein